MFFELALAGDFGPREPRQSLINVKLWRASWPNLLAFRQAYFTLANFTSASKGRPIAHRTRTYKPQRVTANAAQIIIKPQRAKSEKRRAKRAHLLLHVLTVKPTELARNRCATRAAQCANFADCRRERMRGRSPTTQREPSSEQAASSKQTNQLTSSRLLRSQFEVPSRVVHSASSLQRYRVERRSELHS